MHNVDPTHAAVLAPHEHENTGNTSLETAKQAGDRILSRLIPVTAKQVKGAHDADMILVGDRAFIVAEVNDREAGEDSRWHHIYVALSIVNLVTGSVEQVIPFARSCQAFENVTLPEGTCFVPRILQKDARTLRCFFASESPGNRESQIWFIDFDLESLRFENRLGRVKLKTSAGVFDLQPAPFYDDAVLHGFKRPRHDAGVYPVDSFKQFDGRTYSAINNFITAQNALTVLNDDLDTFELLGHYNDPIEMRLTESSVNRMPDGTWIAILRQDGGTGRYAFATSQDGRDWTTASYRDHVPNGGQSKPNFDFFGGQYYLGWQDAEKINGVNRSIFNVDVSKDGLNWNRLWRFETEKTFHYPIFREHNGHIYVAVTQGDHGQGERIMFARVT
jgi:hypothetical protein